MSNFYRDTSEIFQRSDSPIRHSEMPHSTCADLLVVKVRQAMQHLLAKGRTQLLATSDQLLEVAQKITMILGAHQIKKEGILHGFSACFRVFRWFRFSNVFKPSLLLESAKLINLVFESSCQTELRQVQMTHCEEDMLITK